MFKKLYIILESDSMEGRNSLQQFRDTFNKITFFISKQDVTRNHEVYFSSVAAENKSKVLTGL
jgi:hypothetical protein